MKGVNLEKIKWETGNPVSKIGNLPVFKYLTSEPQQDVYILQQDNNQLKLSESEKIISLVVLEKLVGSLSGFYMTRRAWTKPEERGKGYSPELILVLYQKLGFKLVGDDRSTPNGRKLWNKISRTFPVKVWDTKTKQTMPRNNVPDEDLYKPISDPKWSRYLLILECEGTDYSTSNSTLLDDYRFFTEK